MKSQADEKLNKVAFHNLGCKVNAYETNAMIRQFEENGYRIVDFDEKADIYIVNTCTVTGIADKKSRQMLHRAKKRNPDAIVAAVGCYVQADPERVKKDPDVDIVIGNDLKSKAFELITAKKSDYINIGKSDCFESMIPGVPQSRVRAFLKVQDGCNQFCSYCLIPYVRGRVRSVEEDEAAAQISNLVSGGIKEIVLTGIHLSSYGTDGKNGQMGPGLLSLIKRASEQAPGSRIRLGSLEPRIITPGFVNELSRVENLCPHFHLSLQSGCDATLKRMNRHYTAEQYRQAVDLLRDAFEHPAITTDVIVGFPGETDGEFETTRRFLEDIRLYEMHIFKYSLRQGTAASRLPGRVSPMDAQKRSEILCSMSEKNKSEFEKYYRGRETIVLAEEEIEKNGKKYLTGLNPEYVRFDVPSDLGKVGDFIKICP